LATVADERAQADHVIDGVLAHREAGVPLKRQAVLFRNAQHSELLEVELTRRKIPFVKHGGLKFLEAAHVKDVLAVLRWAEQPRNGLAAFRVLQLMPGMGPANARRALDACTESVSLEQALASFVPPVAAREAWSGLLALLAGLAAPDARWAGQIDSVNRWYRPLLERRFDDALVRASDLDMLATAATRFGSRERFLTELALDPPSAAGDLAGTPLLDEDYLILSTVHSAKGQEWDAVWVLNVTDGNFPNEYATGSAAGIAEERRLLYVALTRARDSLELLEPRAFAVTQQRRLGDLHVTGARSRFLDEDVLATLDQQGPQGDGVLDELIGARAAEASSAMDAAADASSQAVRLDVTARLRSRWQA
jgi:DNA helicase-2/ATP-dependent DNA helicase PcrA